LCTNLWKANGLLLTFWQMVARPKAEGGYGYPDLKGRLSKNLCIARRHGESPLRIQRYFIKGSDMIDFVRANRKHLEKRDNFGLSLKKPAAFEFIKAAAEENPDQEWNGL
jgi:hypothetical protein